MWLILRLLKFLYTSNSATMRAYEKSLESPGKYRNEEGVHEWPSREFWIACLQVRPSLAIDPARSIIQFICYFARRGVSNMGEYIGHKHDLVTTHHGSKYLARLHGPTCLMGNPSILKSVVSSIAVAVSSCRIVTLRRPSVGFGAEFYGDEWHQHETNIIESSWKLTSMYWEDDR